MKCLVLELEPGHLYTRLVKGKLWKKSGNNANMGPARARVRDVLTPFSKMLFDIVRKEVV